MQKFVFLTIASDGGSIVRVDEAAILNHVIGAIHEPKVSASVEHVEVDAAVVAEDVGQDIHEICEF